jgi:hypothetical protein
MGRVAYTWKKKGAYMDMTPNDSEEMEEATDMLVREGGATAAAPTVSGGAIGSTMVGGGSISNAEVTDDPLGNGTGYMPKILDPSQGTDEDPEENLGKKVEV